MSPLLPPRPARGAPRIEDRRRRSCGRHARRGAIGRIASDSSPRISPPSPGLPAARSRMSATRPESEPGRQRPKTRRPRGFPVLAGRAGPSPIDGEQILPMKSAPRFAISPPFASSREARQLDERLIPDNPATIARVSVSPRNCSLYVRRPWVAKPAMLARNDTPADARPAPEEAITETGKYAHVTVIAT